MSSLQTKVQRAEISWHNISVKSKQQGRFFFGRKTLKPIINDVSGRVKAGHTLAIMGASGAGKTTLLNVLTARNLSNFVVSGHVKINGEVADVETITSMSAYVQQHDLFLACLTVREHLIFQAMVRIPEAVPAEMKVQRVHEVMQELSLEKCADTIVGGTMSTGKGISGGEMKRLAFAVEILTNPSILFCDEPTSGLDSFMAAHLVTTIDNLAKAGRTVICTIHQPSSDVFNLFENLLLLADGRVAYLGRVGDALVHFSKLGLDCPANYNPADFYIRELAIIPGEESACREKLERICNSYSKITDGKKNTILQSTTDVAQEMDFRAELKSCRAKSRYKVGSHIQFEALAWRSWLVTKREPMLTYVRIGQGMALALVIGVFFYDQHYDQRGIMNINGALFLYLVNLTVQNAFAVINVFCQELPILLREHNSGMYSVGAYYVCKNLSETMVFVIIPILNSCINYYLIGYNPMFDAFLFYILTGIFISLSGVSFGYFISCVCSTTDVALAFGPPIIVPLQLLGGFFINAKSMPSGLSWSQYLSWFYYSFSALIRNQWSQVVKIDCPHHNYSAVGGCVQNGQQVVDFFGLGSESHFETFGGIFIIILFLRIGGYLALLLRARFNR